MSNVWTQFLQKTLNLLNTLQGVQGPWWEPKSSKSRRRKASLAEKNFVCEIRHRNSGLILKNQFFLVVYALRHQDFEDLGSHQGPWTPCKVLSEFKVFCRNGVQTNAIFFEGAETDIWDSTPFNCRWRTWLGHCARCNCNFMYSNIVWKQSTHIEFIELKLN